MATVTNIVTGSTGYGFDASGNQDAKDMVGLIAAFGSTGPPTGWIICEGATLNSSSNTEYAYLYARIGTTWGGSGASSFKVPDLRGQFIRSWANGSANDPVRANRNNDGGNTNATGDAVGSHMDWKFPQQINWAVGARNGGPAVNLQLNQGGVYSSQASYASMTVSHFNGYRHTFNTGGGWNYHTLPMYFQMSAENGATQGRPENMYVTYCIKY